VANDLTGDFDVVAEFSLPAVNRLLAAMHGFSRFPHSLSLRVDDIPQPPDRVRPSVLEIIDLAGDPIVSPGRIGVPAGNLLPSTESADRFARLGGIVNSISFPPIVPSQLQGRAQLQLSPPTLEIADAAASRISVRLKIKARYFADPNTPPATEFAAGDIVLTTAVNQITSQAGNVVDIDLRSNAVQAAFVPTWTSRSLSAEDLAGINLLIGNALKSSVLPSNNMLPSNIRAMKFKAVQGAEQAIAVLLNTTSAPGNPGTVQREFLAGSDFAFAAGADAIQAAIQPALDEMLATPISPVQISVPLVLTSATATYTIALTGATFALETGRMLLTINGRATTPAWFAPNFDFTVKQPLTLATDGSAAELVVGAISLDTSSWIVDLFRGRATGPLAAARDRALLQSGVKGSVRRMLDAERNLGGFLRSLLTPTRPANEPVPAPLEFTLVYTAVEITPAGVVLRGALSVADPPPAHVEFAEIPSSASDPIAGALATGSEHSAFKSWIPGGTIESYEWKRAGNAQPGPRDERTFVLLPQGPVVSDGLGEGGGPHPITAFQPMCLTVRGTRLSSSGPIRLEPVTASYCAFDWFPLFDAASVDSHRIPLVTLTRAGARGEVEVVGHAAAVNDDNTRATPNLILHFGEAGDPDPLNRIREALGNSGRTDASTSIVAVLPAGQLATARHVPGVLYLEQADHEWERVWNINIRQRPATVIIAQTGKTVWQHEGEIESSTLRDTLRRVLVARRTVRRNLVTPVSRIGHAPPNFLFTVAPGHDLTLRKLAGRPVVLVFWRTNARLSLDAARTAATSPPHPDWKNAVVLAINDGEATDDVAKARNADPITIVPDPTRSISRAFGVQAWPTLVFIDARGLVRDVRQGLSVDDYRVDVERARDGYAL
jgi:hypothetical protein